MTYEEALAYIHKISWRGSRPGLTRITELCAALGDPQKDLKCIHVAGTNGKGSFCAMLSSVLIEQGYRVGTFTSPYIVRFNDRMCFCGKEIPDGELAALVEEIRPVADGMVDPPTEFELITAIGFMWFKRKNCDVVILEAGMGGRLDSTNVIEKPLLSVITGIDFDHMALLGNTLEKIAWEKAGIIKERCPVLLGEVGASALGVIRGKAQKLHAPLAMTPYEDLSIEQEDLSGTVISFGDRKHIALSLLGTYQPLNASNVITAVSLLQKVLPVSDEALRRGLASTVWHARFEILSREPLILYDGGHNKQGIGKCAESLVHYGLTRVNLITGVMKDKSYEDMIALLSPLTETCVTVSPPNPRSLTAEDLAGLWSKQNVPSAAAASAEEAVLLALENHKKNGLPIVCTGSLYMYETLASAIAKLI